jgi:hypothetical protein
LRVVPIMLVIIAVDSRRLNLLQQRSEQKGNRIEPTESLTTDH